MRIETRTKLVEEVKKAYKDNLGDPTSSSFFKFEVDESGENAPAFYFGEEISSKSDKNFEKEIKKHFFTGLIPNVISGNLFDSKVILLNLNMGTGEHDESLFEDANNSEDYKYGATVRAYNESFKGSPQFKFNPNYTEQIKKEYNKLSPENPNKKKSDPENQRYWRDYSFSATAFNEFVKHSKMKEKIDEIIDQSYNVKAAGKEYTSIFNQLSVFQELFNCEKVTEEDIHKKEDYADLDEDIVEILKEYNLNTSESDDLQEGINSLSNFYRQIVIPLLQIKFPFEESLQMAPIFLASDDYYTAIGGKDNKGGNANKLKVDNFRWDNWTTFLEKNAKPCLSFKDNSLLKSLGVTSFSDILFIQSVPYASHKFHPTNQIKNQIQPWTDFIKKFFESVNNYNSANPKDRITIIINRVGGMAEIISNIKEKYNDTPVYMRKVSQNKNGNDYYVGCQGGYLSCSQFIDIRKKNENGKK